MSPELEILLIASIVAVACALPGVFLVLRRMSLMSDAISHSVLFGIVIAFFITQNLNSPFLIIAAAFTGILTVTLTELLIKTKRVKEDAAIGLVFPLLFSIAVILITKFAENVHLDTDAVLLGEIAFAPFNRFTVNGLDLGPQALWIMGTILALNMILLVIFYKELKLATFDSALAATLGFAPGWIHYGLMGMVSVTAVGAFDVVGSILVVALIIAPPATAFLLTKRLWNMIALSVGIGIASALTGYYIAFVLDVSIAGSMATMAGVIFLIVLIIAPYRGLLPKILLKQKQKITFATHMLAVHLLDHEGKPEEKEESRAATIHKHMRWDQKFSQRIIKKSQKTGLINEGTYLKLTSLGRDTARQVMIMT